MKIMCKLCYPQEIKEWDIEISGWLDDLFDISLLTFAESSYNLNLFNISIARHCWGEFPDLDFLSNNNPSVFFEYMTTDIDSEDMFDYITQYRPHIAALLNNNVGHDEVYDIGFLHHTCLVGPC